MNFKDWSETAQTEQTLMVRRDHTRDIYTFPNGIKVYEDLRMPFNPFAPQQHWVTVDFTVKEGDERVAQAGGTIENWYEEEGYGHPQFAGDDAMEKAFNFALQLKERV